MLAAAGLQGGSDHIDPALDEVLQGSPHRDGAAPVGAVGTPIHRCWAIAWHLVVGHPDSPAVIAEHLAAMAARYVQALHSAQASEYLWRTGLAPVDIGDIDLAGITALATRRFGPAFLVQLAERVGPVGATPIMAGLDLANGSGRTFARY